MHCVKSVQSREEIIKKSRFIGEIVQQHFGVHVELQVRLPADQLDALKQFLSAS